MLDGTTASPDLLAALAQQHTARCVERLAEVLDGDDAAASVEAARELLSRGYGQPPLTLAFDGSSVTIEVDTGTEAQEPHRTNGKHANGPKAWNVR
jgi:hypothetical protein